MSLLGRVLSRVTGAVLGNRKSRRAHAAKTRRRLKATFDSAQTTSENEDHWAWADGLNANAAADPSTRQTLRERAQYECDNNPYLWGLVDKLGNDLVGRLPRPQLRIPGVARDVTRKIERAFVKWARVAQIGSKLRLLDNAAIVRGESFGILTHNPALPADGVQLDLRLYETDQVSTPWFDYMNVLNFDGGKLDTHGNVTEWHFLKSHPGSSVWVANFLDYDAIPAGEVIHWFKPRRAGQIRGVSEVLSSLTLYGYLRRLTLATVVAAETAANIAGVLETDVAAPDAGIRTTPGDEVDIPRGSLLQTPAGWKVTQLKAEQPTNGYDPFKTSLLTEAGQPVGAPQNISTGSSAAYNYSSGRLDHGIYQRGMGIRRSDLRDRVLDPLFRAWLDEAALVPGLIPDGLPLRSEWSWEWQFDGFSSMDPQKEATANKTRLETGETNLATICAENGEDWEEVMEQRAREFERQKELRRPSADAAVPGSVPGSNAPATGAPAGLSDSQVSTLLKIIDRVTAGVMASDAAKAIIRVAFPAMPSASIDTIVDAIKGEPASAA